MHWHYNNITQVLIFDFTTKNSFLNANGQYAAGSRSTPNEILSVIRYPESYPVARISVMHKGPHPLLLYGFCLFDNVLLKSDPFSERRLQIQK